LALINALDGGWNAENRSPDTHPGDDANQA